MRGDMQPELHHGGLQNDSSSGSSSPHSSTSHEDILEVRGPELLPKAIYNFSIPEVIKHEPRIDRDSARNEPGHEVTRRKRNRSFNSLNPDTQHHHRTDIVETPVIVQTKKRRKGKAAAAAAAAAVADMIDRQDDEDDNCYRQNVPVIDLTGTDSHDEYTNAHSDSEPNNESSSIFRPFQSAHAADSFNNVLSHWEQYHQRLQARNRQRDHFYLRNPFARMQRLHRYRRRANEVLRSRQIVTDGPLVTADMLIPNTPEPVDITTPTSTTAPSLDDSIVVVNEVRGNQAEDDYTVALRMQNDPTYSPPYLNRGYGYCRRQTNPLYQRIRTLRQQRRDIESNPGRLGNLRMRFNQRATESEDVGENNDSAEAAEQNNATTERESRSRERRYHQRNNNAEPRQDCADAALTAIVEDMEVDNASARRRTEASEHPMSNSRSNANSDDDDGEVEFIGITNLASHLQRPTLRSLGRHSSPLQFAFTNNNLLQPMHTGHNSEFAASDLSNFGPLTTYRLHHDNYLALFNFTERINPVEDYEEFLNLADRIGPAKPRGLEKSDIERIPSFRFSSSTAKETNAKCVVCISEYTNREKLRRLPCSHDFHAKCIDKWLKSNKTCPVCRDEVNPSSAC